MRVMHVHLGVCEVINSWIPNITCIQAGIECGPLWNGCHTINCGECYAGTICNAGNCVPYPCTPTKTCIASNVECGPFYNGCEINNCGTCSSRATCSAGTCVPI
jgi:hypothetical protein